MARGMLRRRSRQRAALLLVATLAACGGGGPAASPPRLVAGADGSLELRVGERVLFALAAGGPVARNFVETATGIGTVSFVRSDERLDPLHFAGSGQRDGATVIDYRNADGTRAATLVARVDSDESSSFALTLHGPAADSLAVAARCDADGTFHGFGEQYNATDQRGEAFPLLVNEQGNGRDGGPGVSVGDAHTTYFPMPWYLDARGFGVLVDTARRVDVDLCAGDPQRAWIEVVGGSVLRWQVFHGPAPRDVIRQLGDVVGRPALPPDWAWTLWIGAQGGRAAVLAEAAALEAAGIPAGALWVQDWTGRRLNLDGGFGVQYGWRPQEDCADAAGGVCYPDFAGLVRDLRGRGYRFLVYVNPFIVATVADPPAGAAERYRRMEEGGLLVVDASGRTIRSGAVPNFGQRDAHPDFSKPATLEFIRDSLASIVRDYGVDGWMADFGEWLPIEAQFADGSSAIERRNTFPVDWQRASREAMASVRPDGDWAVFGRSGWTGVQGTSMIHWTGDQETNWGTLDGLPTVVPALLNLGLAGQPYVTHDIAGFAKGRPSTKELFQRWTELGAFTPIMRTHEGADRDNNWSWKSDAETTAHFRRFVFVHCALREDFATLAAAAQAEGAPILRHLMLEFPDDPETPRLHDQFLVGDALLVAPVVAQGATTRRLYLPQGDWFDVWSGTRYAGGRWVTVAAPIGSPPVFSRGRDRSDLRDAEARLRFADCR